MPFRPLLRTLPLRPADWNAGREAPRRGKRRRGATTVEMAVVLPTFLVFVFGIIQAGHAMWVNNLLRNSVREAARLGSTEGVTTDDVEAAIRQLMRGIIEDDALTIDIRDASIYDQESDQPTDWESIGSLPQIELFDANPRQLFVVRAQCDMTDAALIRLPFAEGLTLSGQAFMRHE